MTRTTGIRDTWRQMARRPGGASSAEVAKAMGVELVKLGRSAWRLKEAGELFSGARSHKNVRYFGTQREADTWAAAMTVKPSLTIKAVRLADDWKTQTPIVPAGFKVTICPTRWT